MYDYTKLQERILEKFGSPEAFAERIDRSVAYVYERIGTPQVALKQTEITAWCEVLDIAPAEIQEYFFKLRSI